MNSMVFQLLRLYFFHSAAGWESSFSHSGNNDEEAWTKKKLYFRIECWIKQKQSDKCRRLSVHDLSFPDRANCVCVCVDKFLARIDVYVVPCDWIAESDRPEKRWRQQWRRWQRKQWQKRRMNFWKCIEKEISFDYGTTTTPEIVVQPIPTHCSHISMCGLCVCENR